MGVVESQGVGIEEVLVVEYDYQVGRKAPQDIEFEEAALASRIALRDPANLRNAGLRYLGGF